MAGIALLLAADMRVLHSQLAQKAKRPRFRERLQRLFTATRMRNEN